jgi:(p)ppGpp synthase/HD superfamily hydrolase
MRETFTDLPLLTDRFDRALRMASDHHRSQLRKGTEIPYLSHLLGVTSLVLEMGGTEDEAVAALLHDAVEDGGGEPMLERIRAEFGADVARIVFANSDTIVEPKPPWLERKRMYVESIASKEPDELRVSLADKLHNVRAIVRDFRTHGSVVWTRFSAGERGVRWYYGAMYDALSEQREALGPAALPVLDDLGRTLEELDSLVRARRSPR